MSEYTSVEIRPSQPDGVADAAGRHDFLATMISGILSSIEERWTSIPESAAPDLRSATPAMRLPDACREAMATARSLPGRGGSPVLRDSARLVALAQALEHEALSDLSTASLKALPDVQRLAAEISPLVRSGNVHSLAIHQRRVSSSLAMLTSAVRSGHRQLAIRDRDRIASLLSRSMGEIGYRNVSLKTKGDRLIVRGSDHVTSMFAAVPLEGALTIDTAGFTGNACTHAVDRLLESLRQAGMEVSRKASHRHGSDGGELVKEAAPLFDPLAAPSPQTAFADQHRRARIANGRLRN
jgi:hypothetical protein